MLYTIIGQCYFDLELINKKASLEHVPYTKSARITKCSVWMISGYACGVFPTIHRSIWLWPLLFRHNIALGAFVTLLWPCSCFSMFCIMLPFWLAQHLNDSSALTSNLLVTYVTTPHLKKSWLCLYTPKNLFLYPQKFIWGVYWNQPVGWSVRRAVGLSAKSCTFNSSYSFNLNHLILAVDVNLK